MEKELLGLTEKEEVKWASYLREFHDDVYPMFKPFGISMGDAMMIFKLNELRNDIVDLSEALTEEDSDDGDDDGWTKTS